MNSTSVESIEFLIIETFDKIKEKEREYQKLQMKIVVTFSLSAIVLGVFCWFFVKNFLRARNCSFIQLSSFAK